MTTQPKPPTHADIYGNRIIPRGSRRDTSRMTTPVECNLCDGVYDLSGVETDDPTTGRAYGRYADCTRYKTPCCKRIVDDRPRGLVTFPAFTRIPR